uniref:Uncharacterized protein n=1 Tax=Timema shepardi TaxID=629360 RepID=A0A7R9G0A1_TIMSH|nr:unnamed protein product [Timema shepardi]
MIAGSSSSSVWFESRGSGSIRDIPVNPNQGGNLSDWVTVTQASSDRSREKLALEPERDRSREQPSRRTNQSGAVAPQRRPPRRQAVGQLEARGGPGLNQVSPPPLPDIVLCSANTNPMPQSPAPAPGPAGRPRAPWRRTPGKRDWMRLGAELRMIADDFHDTFKRNCTRESGKTGLKSNRLVSNTDLLVIGSQVYCESRALDRVATETSLMMFLVLTSFEEINLKLEPSEHSTALVKEGGRDGIELMVHCRDESDVFIGSPDRLTSWRFHRGKLRSSSVSLFLVL